MYDITIKLKNGCSMEYKKFNTLSKTIDVLMNSKSNLVKYGLDELIIKYVDSPKKKGKL